MSELLIIGSIALSILAGQLLRKPPEEEPVLPEGVILPTDAPSCEWCDHPLIPNHKGRCSNCGA